MSRIALVFSFLIISFAQSFACINNVNELKDGATITNDKFGFDIPYGHILLTDKLQPEAEKLDSLWKVTKDVDYYSDYGLIKIVQGKYEEAKNVFLEIEKIKPGRFETAANLGTTYERLGDYSNALKWIKTAIAIEPLSHIDSEWLHVKILEAKIHGDTYITSDFLINTDFGDDTIPSTNLNQSQLLKLKSELFYQLNEQITFQKSEDKIIGLLLFDLGNSLLALNRANAAIEAYEMAKTYGYSNYLLDIRHDYAKNLKANVKVVPKNSVESQYLLIFIGSVCFLIFPVFMFFYLKGKMNSDSN
ncbi:MAG: tetratricopeptide repeat protein [Cytophaga sp.]|uniref:tetratricopeptide repeat protein n=1 Tax=Cytophaga sp. TaxID=29535 RepID=UPI003F81FAF3